MNVDVEVKNLGRLKEGTINIRPITIIAGPNGTGKSFFTKTLYSIFNVINKNVYQLALTRLIDDFLLILDRFEASIPYEGVRDANAIELFRHSIRYIRSQLTDKQDIETSDYLFFVELMEVEIDELVFEFDLYHDELLKKPKKYSSVSRFIERMASMLKLLHRSISDSSRYYSLLINSYVEDELQENFQIQKASDLIRLGEESALIKIHDLFEVTISSSGVRNNIEITHEFFEDIAQLSSVVFFESPAYWKVREALRASKGIRRKSIVSSLSGREVLSGVPKYFYDIDDAINVRTKLKKNALIKESLLDSDNDSKTEIFKSVRDIDSAINGEFLFDGDTITFKDFSTGKEIAKNLMSFGMTNLGMISALIKNDVIKKGSFVFIDEPETNLHPEWQVLLSKVLIELAEHNVHVVIATHSTDMLKAIEVSVRDKLEENTDFMSVHYFSEESKLLKLESKNSLNQLGEVIEELNEPFESLYYEGLREGF